MTSLLNVPYQVVISAPDSQIAFDCTVSEQHTDKLSITEHPVETGAKVSDHAQKQPDSLTLQGIISNSPILLNVAEDIQPSVAGGTPENRAQDAYNEFLRLQRTASLLTVATELRDYDSMMIESIDVRRDKATRNILDIGLTLREFRRASVETTDAPEPVEPVHRGRRKQGRKQTKAATPEAQQKQTSLLSDLANAFGGTG